MNLHDVYKITYKKMLIDILDLIYLFSITYDKIKENKRLKSVKTINNKFKDAVKEELRKKDLADYIEVICLSSYVLGELDIQATLKQKDISVYGDAFLEKFQTIKELIMNHNLLIEKGVNNYKLSNQDIILDCSDDKIVEILLFYTGDDLYKYISTKDSLKNKKF